MKYYHGESKEDKDDGRKGTKSKRRTNTGSNQFPIDNYNED